jgi:predicted nucleotidyltransferase
LIEAVKKESITIDTQSFYIRCNCAPYSGDLKLIQELESCITSLYKDLFRAVIVHGSVATGEIINYSDFDGLLIIKDQYKNSAELREFIKKSLRLIYQFDPLQHHGWFIIYESQLQNYPQTYFPYELFGYSRLIYPDNEVLLKISMPSVIDYTKPFKKMAMSLKDKLEKGFRPRGMYQLKSFLSELMLLPALYYQAKFGKGVFKKYSFELTMHDFSSEAWDSIKISSEIRRDWHYKFIFPEQLFVRLETPKFIKKYVRKYMAPPIPDDTKKKLNEQFYGSCQQLAYEMSCKLNEIQDN